MMRGSGTEYTEGVDLSGQYVGNYCLLRLLGRGSFASVYLGRHRYLDRLAAVKVLHTVLDDQDKEQFLTEAKLLAKLSHPNIVQVHEFAVTRRVNHGKDKDFTDYIPYLVMDFAPGGSLRGLYTVGSCLFIDVAIGYIKQIASALQYAHDHGIIHRDVKPENCLLNERQEVMLSDFGLALLAPSPGLLSTQQMAGTLPYTAPEQLRGKPDFASDQYSLGVMAYEWLCGHRPFLGEGVELIVQHMSAPPPSLRRHNPAIAQAVEEVVLKALEKHPQQRYPSVLAFTHALERACNWQTAGFSPGSDRTVRAFSTGRKTTSGSFTSFPLPWKFDTPNVSEAKRRQTDEEGHVPLVKQKFTSILVGKVQKQRPKVLSVSSKESKRRPLLLIGTIVFILLLLLSSGLYCLLTPLPPLVMAFGSHPAATPLSVTSPALLFAKADFTSRPARVRGMILTTNQTTFEGDHAVLNAGQQVAVDFTFHYAQEYEKSNQVSIIIKALVSRSGKAAGYAPIDMYCDGQVFVQDLTVPGDGSQPETLSLQIPPSQLVSGKNEFRLLVSSHAMTPFWIYSIGIVSETFH